jgi:hypothetical protein
VLLGYQPLTDGVCDDVLDVVEGVASETVIELTREEIGIKERENRQNIHVFNFWPVKSHTKKNCCPNPTPGLLAVKI